MVESVHCMTEEEETIEISRGGFWARLFDTDPTLHIWDKTKTVTTVKMNPAMYIVGSQIVYHPALKSQIYHHLNVA